MLTGAALWGVSGTAAQYLFQERGFSSGWLTVVRLLLGGLVLLGIAYKQDRTQIWGIWTNKSDRISILLFGIPGMLATQYTYFAAIQHGNAATATVLQYLAPALITCYLALRSRRLPGAAVIVSVAIAVLGTVLLATGGRIGSLAISGQAVFWGIASAFALAFYTLQPLRLLARWSSLIVVGWGMLIGGIFSSLIHPPWHFEGKWSPGSLVAVAFVVIFGTIIAFYCYMESTRNLPVSEVSLLASVEPLSAAVISVAWLHVRFGLAEWLGTLCIVATIIILARAKEGST